MPAKPEVVSADQFLSSRKPGSPFQIKVEGPGIESYLGRTACGYFEWIYGERSNGKISSFSVAYQSRERFIISVDGKRVEVQPNGARAYLSPTFEKDYSANDTSAPEVVRDYLKEGHAKAVVAEYCLEVGKTYWAAVHEDRYHLPPEGPGEPPREGSRKVLRISDKPFVDGKPGSEMTPAYRGWSY